MNLVVSGPSGAGKGTVVRRLCAEDQRLWLSQSWTTRARRPGEAEDAYYFADRDSFESLVEAHGFLEWAKVLDEYYGTPLPRPPAGCDAVFEIDVQGAEQLRARLSEVVCVLLVPPSVEVQRARLLGRGDAEEQVARRLELGKNEVERAKSFVDEVVVNDDLARAVAELHGIVARARLGFAARRTTSPPERTPDS